MWAQSRACGAKRSVTCTTIGDILIAGSSA
jgi:hypothetical protein